MSVPGGFQHPMSQAPGYGRIHVEDPRDWDLRSVLESQGVEVATPTLKARRWRRYAPLPLNQGNTPKCVGFSGEGQLIVAPIHQTYPGGGDALYVLAQQYDGVPGPHDGSTGRGLMKGLQKQDRVSAYAFAKDIQTVALAVSTLGPGLAGTNFYLSMESPDPKTFEVKIAPGSPIAGGHEYLVFAVNPSKAYFEIENSWGPNWGDKGRAIITFETLERLLFQEDGDYVTPTEVKP